MTIKCKVKGVLCGGRAMCGAVLVGSKDCSLPPLECEEQIITLEPWAVVSGNCATRVIEGGFDDEISDRFAFIEKTPRVRISLDENGAVWEYGPKGEDGYGKTSHETELNGFYQPSRDWCDMVLAKHGFILL